jgi:hypothetical protein
LIAFEKIKISLSTGTLPVARFSRWLLYSFGGGVDGGQKQLQLWLQTAAAEEESAGRVLVGIVSDLCRMANSIS